MAHLVEDKMKELDFDEISIDPTGNVVGRVGNGPKVIHFDSHMDTVQVNDPEDWKADPFRAELVDGMIYGRGSVDMKGGLAASVYAAAFAKKAGLLEAHGSAPEKGINAVYEMAEIITRVEQLNKKLQATPGAGTIVLSHISCVTASLNAVPSQCEIYLDRRLRLGESVAQVEVELDALIAGKRASWEPGTLRHTSWTGAELVYEPAHEPWKIAEDAPLTRACDEAYEVVFGEKPQGYDFWDFGTNAVVPVSMGVATIGFGPGEYKLAHMTNERCDPKKVEDACRFYTQLIGLL